MIRQERQKRVAISEGANHNAKPIITPPARRQRHTWARCLDVRTALNPGGVMMGKSPTDGWIDKAATPFWYSSPAVLGSFSRSVPECLKLGFLRWLFP